MPRPSQQDLQSPYLSFFGKILHNFETYMISIHKIFMQYGPKEFILVNELKPTI